TPEVPVGLSAPISAKRTPFERKPPIAARRSLRESERFIGGSLVRIDHVGVSFRVVFVQDPELESQLPCSIVQCYLINTDVMSGVEPKEDHAIGSDDEVLGCGDDSAAIQRLCDDSVPRHRYGILDRNAHHLIVLQADAFESSFSAGGRDRLS